MSRSAEEIIRDVSSAKYTSASGPLLDLCRELAAGARFEELALSIAIWISRFPESSAFVRARIPAIVLNSYLVRLDLLEFSEFLKWEEGTDWAKQIAAHADNPKALPSTVEAIVNSMKSFTREIA